MKFTSLQVRLMGTFLVTIAVLAIIGLSILINARNTATTYETSLSALVKVGDLTQAVDEGARSVGKLASEPDPNQAVADYRPVEERIYQLREGLPTSTQHPDSVWMMQDLANMADSFLVEAGAAVYAFRRDDPESYFKHDREAATIAVAVRDTADRLLAKELEQYSKVYPEVIRRDRKLQATNTISLIALTLVAIAFAWGFAQTITDPLRHLARAAGRIAGGDLSGPPVPVGTGSEVQMLGSAFNHMQESLRQHVTELQEKAELERRLQAEELENLQIHSLLWQVELRALQSQVNPHFLFNTLNMVAKTALIEGAEQTRELMETVADLLRYSLRELNRPVTLGEEVGQVQRYMTIQGQRFRERTQFVLELDETALACPMPCLTLQPLVENALIHGIGKREAGGIVKLAVRRSADRILVTISDDGEGIPAARLATLNQDATALADGTGGHTTGLGIQNVRRRLELYYHSDAGLTVDSVPGRGTVVMLDLPACPEGANEGAHPGG
ncbi:MAG TPA: sensor histidine kinase [Symbiobacteriaceae bacterium]